MGVRMRNISRRGVIPVFAALAAAAAVAGCGSSSDLAQTTPQTREARVTDTCPNITSKATFFTVKNAIAQQAVVSTDGWSCDTGDWSETGNPGKFDGQMLPASGAIPRVRFEVKEYYSSIDWTMRFVYPDGTAEVALELNSGNADDPGLENPDDPDGPGLKIRANGESVDSAVVGSLDDGGTRRDIVATVDDDPNDPAYSFTLSTR